MRRCDRTARKSPSSWRDQFRWSGKDRGLPGLGEREVGGEELETVIDDDFKRRPGGKDSRDLEWLLSAREEESKGLLLLCSLF